MFRTAAAKLAHNSTLPALAGNKDLKPLQDLITAEKAVLHSLQRLSVDVTKSTECLRHWGAGEGDDLQDVLAASSTLLGYLSSALLRLADHESSIREHMKAVRTQEENLDELRRRRKAIYAKADTAEKRLSKMNPEHKNLQQQTELLNNLREQIKNIDWDILSEEAKLGDFKRTSTKNWMTLKFGGLLECAEKATITAEMGRLVIEEIPLETTEPGQTRRFYTAYDKTEKILSEAQRCIAEVAFDPQLSSPLPGTKTSGPEGRNSNSIDGLPSGGNLGSSSYFPGAGMTGNSLPESGPTADEFGGLGDARASRNFGTMPSPMPTGSMPPGDDGSRFGSTVSGSANSPFSSTIGTPGSPHASRFSSGGGQFSTFPARKASLPGSGLGSPPGPNQNSSLQPLDEATPMTSSFAAEVADALAYAEGDGSRQQPSAPVQGKTSLDGPAPSYETHDWTPSFSSGSGLPRGAAPPTVEHNPWNGGVPPPPPPSSLQVDHQPGFTGPPSSYSQPQTSRHARENEHTEDDEEDTQLPYASPPPIDHQLPSAPGEPGSRRVHFGGGQSGAEANEDSQVTVEHIPTPPPHNDAEVNNAAAREVAREMDMLSFNPPPGPPPGHIDARAPSPLMPPAPPFAQQRRVSPPHDYSGTLSPRSEGMSNNSKTDLHGQSSAPNVDAPSPQSASNLPPSPSLGHQTRPSMSINVQSPSPAYSFNSTTASTYGTPPEMPAIQPMRTGSPASPSILNPGARTISAAAFKRPGIRSPSGGGPPSSDARPLPDVSPLALRKKSGGGPGLPSSPYAGSREVLPNLPQGPGQESAMDPRAGPLNETPHSPAPDYESTYDFVSSYGDPAGNATQEAHHSPGGGYGQGRFATNLDGEGLR